MSPNYLNNKCKVKQTKVKYLVPGSCFYLWKPKVRIIWIHASYLFPCWCTKNLQEHAMSFHENHNLKETNATCLLQFSQAYLDDLNKLIYSIFSRKQRLKKGRT